MPEEPPADAGERIDRASTSIRERINDPRLRYKLLKDHKAWNQITSSLDCIGDTEYALCAYLTHDPEQAGSRYLFLYGVLQALTIQQDAVRHLTEAVGSTPSDDPRLREARRVRIEAAGHPTKKDRPKGSAVTSHQVGRMSIHQGGFMMVTSDEHGQIQTEHVDLAEAIANQREAIAERLEALDAELDRQDRELLMNHKDERLVDVFPDTLGYSLEKIQDGILSGHGLGPAGLEHVKQVIAAFAQALEKRGLSTDAYLGVRGWYDEIGHPIAELEAFFDHKSELHPKTASILASHLRDQMDQLKNMAEEIDEDWRVKPT